ncbi:acyltransferase [Cohnella cholangitidis]|uniref:Acyltransferase n=1 Tax=Cohnella cholangitidis TaxID=2598458 RepID=A0A7G5C200_9BACL|nr:acyltransferase [Cohnella cholangitidis]QMV43234.1 acyltransferase [Cohnella cholangitidis]
MAKWIGTLHGKLRSLMNKAFTLLWYRFLFHRIGEKSSISTPFYTYRPDAIGIGDQVSMGPACRLEAYPEDPLAPPQMPMLKIGNRVRLEHRVMITCLYSVVIEDDALIASGCYISDNNHSIDPEGPSYSQQPSTYAPTRIGKGVWLGQNVCVLAGSEIGEKSVIGAGSVVKGVIPPYSIAVGSPARVVKRYCFDTKTWVKAELRESVVV